MVYFFFFIIIVRVQEIVRKGMEFKREWQEWVYVVIALGLFLSAERQHNAPPTPSGNWSGSTIPTIDKP